MLLGYITSGLLIALQPPFYPSEAEKKGNRSYFFVLLLGGLRQGVLDLKRGIEDPIQSKRA